MNKGESLDESTLPLLLGRFESDFTSMKKTSLANSRSLRRKTRIKIQNLLAHGMRFSSPLVHSYEASTATRAFPDASGHDQRAAVTSVKAISTSRKDSIIWLYGPTALRSGTTKGCFCLGQQSSS
mmetsp:Transcript_4905/g.9910  ORF Transcript_4905/g.9910 Transcript_4905/m.9910 type:complete len:125 (+) Transcript_4905:1406-1780(+)